MFTLEFPGWIVSAFIFFYLFPVIAVGLTISWRGSKTHLPWHRLRAIDMDEFRSLRIGRHIPVYNLWVVIVAIRQMRRQLSRGIRDFIAQYEHFQVILGEDHRWMAHDRIVDTLTTRYRDAWDEHWQSKHFKRVDRLRRDLNLEPQYNNAKFRKGPVTTEHVLPGSFIPDPDIAEESEEKSLKRAARESEFLAAWYSPDADLLPEPKAFNITPPLPLNGGVTYTFDDDGRGGTFDPPSATASASNPVVTSTYTPAEASQETQEAPES